MILLNATALVMVALGTIEATSRRARRRGWWRPGISLGISISTVAVAALDLESPLALAVAIAILCVGQLAISLTATPRALPRFFREAEAVAGE